MRRLVYFTLASLVLLAGCVSTKTYEGALSESKARQSQLEKTEAELKGAKEALAKSGKENEQLKKDASDLAATRDKEVSALKAQLEELSSKGIMTSKEVEDLKAEKQRLSESDRTKTDELKSRGDELAAAKKDLASRATELEELKQEKEKLSASDRAKTEELKSRNEELANQAKEKEYLGRENERLKVKAGEISTEKEKEIANVKNTYENLVKEMQKEIEKGDIKITRAVDRLSVNMVEKVLFDSGEAEVKPEGLKVLKRVGDILKNVSDRQIRVEGHTDNVQIGARIRKKYPSNWELSTARATNVVRYLQDRVGVDPARLSAAGLSAYKPVATNDTTEGRAQNRRIEIVLLPLDVDRVLQELKK